MGARTPTDTSRVAYIFRVRALLAAFVVVTVGCTGVGEAVVGSCLSVALQVGAQVCVDAVCSSVCDDDDPPPPDPSDDEARQEVPPPDPGVDENGAPRDAATAALCRLQLDDGSALRLGCVDGTSALAVPLGGGNDVDARAFDDKGVRTVEGDVFVDDAADVADLAGVFAITGNLRVQSPVLLRLRLPSLRRIGGDLVVVRNPRLVRLELPAVVDVGGSVVVVGNDALSADPLPALKKALRVDVVENAALPAAVTSRLMSLGD